MAAIIIKQLIINYNGQSQNQSMAITKGDQEIEKMIKHWFLDIIDHSLGSPFLADTSTVEWSITEVWATPLLDKWHTRLKHLENHQQYPIIAFLSSPFAYGKRSIFQNHSQRIPGSYPQLIWLVVEPPLWKMMECKSVGMIVTFPIYGKIMKYNKNNVPKHQPVVVPMFPSAWQPPHVFCWSNPAVRRMTPGGNGNPSPIVTELTLKLVVAHHPGGNIGKVPGRSI